MNKRILALIAAFVLVSFFAEISPTMLQNSGLAWINSDSLFGRHGFYFKKRQWLADLRTIMAALRYLYVAPPTAPGGLTSAADSPDLMPGGAEVQTNLTGSNTAEVSFMIPRNKLWRNRRMLVLYCCPVGAGQMTCLMAFDGPYPNGLGAMRLSPFGIKSCVPEPGASLLPLAPQRCLALPVALPKSRPDVTATNLQGA